MRIMRSERMRKMARRRKVTELITVLIGFVSFIVILGSVGALDDGTIGYKQFFIQVMLGMIPFAGSAVMLNYISIYERR